MVTTRLVRLFPVALLGVILVSCTMFQSSTKHAAPPRPAAWASWEDSVLASMSLEEEVGQMVMVGVFGHYFSNQADEYDRIVRAVTETHVGGVILWQSDVFEAAVRMNALQQKARVPLLVAADLERGLSMRVRRGTTFPDAMAVGATRNPLYAYEIGKAIAEEARALGIHQNYAPVADVNTNPLNPVINTRAFGDNVDLVSSMVNAFVRGSLDGGVIPTIKHFPGHGDTGVDSHLELPVLRFTRARMDSVELKPFRIVSAESTISVMVAHLAAPGLGASDTVPGTLSPELISGTLRHDLGFRGLIVTDAMEMHAVRRSYTPAQAALLAVKAGVDIILMTPDVEAVHAALVDAVRRGEIPKQRIDESVRRILAAKALVGLNKVRSVGLEDIPREVGTRDHLDLAREVARNAVTLLRNEASVLPLREGQRLASIVISDSEDSRIEVNRSSYPWPNEPPGQYFHALLRRNGMRVEATTLSPASDEADGDRAVAMARRADVVLLPIFVKVRTSSGRIGIPSSLLPIIDRVQKTGRPVVVISFGNPYVVAGFPGAQGVLCAYGDSEPLTEAVEAVLDGRQVPCGKLPVTVTGAYPYGSGLGSPSDRLTRIDPAEQGIPAVRFHALDSILTAAVRDSAFPAAEVLVAHKGAILYRKAFGHLTFDPAERETDNSTMFDMASVTKVASTTSAVMKLYDEGRLSLDDPVSKYLPQFGTPEKAPITLRHLLTHRSGFPPFRQFFLFCNSAQEELDSIYATRLVATPGDTTIYSDLGMITMGKVVEKITGMPIDQFVTNEFFEPLGMTSTMFNPPRTLLGRIAPTEFDSLWRKVLVRGQVHDENAALLGGVSGHAGLFSTASDLAILAQMLLNKGTYAGRRYLSEETVQLFTQAKQPYGDRYLGWDSRSARGSSSGKFFSSASFGHTGFTGTSVWIDPVRATFVILLTNRVYPTRANMKIARVRPAVHDAVIRAIDPESTAGVMDRAPQERKQTERGSRTQ